MKTIHQINFWTLMINIFLAIVPFLGMLFMMVLGLVQIALAFAITFCHYSRLNHNMRMMIIVYWIFVAIDFAGIALMAGSDNFHTHFTSILTLFVFPACIAIYFVYTTYTITKNLSHEHPAPQY